MATRRTHTVLLQPLLHRSTFRPRYLNISALQVKSGDDGWHGNLNWDWDRPNEASTSQQPETKATREFEGSIVITERAAKHISRLRQKQSKPTLSLRVGVESGGCHGYQYKFTLLPSLSPPAYDPSTDLIFSSPTGDANVVTDRTSLKLLNGSKVDYTTELIGSSFKVTDNPNAKNAGCGCGISWSPN